jgi:hypothetical protein
MLLLASSREFAAQGGSRMKYAVLAACLFAVVLCTGCGVRSTIKGGEEFASLAALNERQKADGFVPLGKFGDSWPATVTEIVHGKNEISFTLANGSSQGYPGYDGYTLLMVRLLSKSGGEVVAVYRSEKKK